MSKMYSEYISFLQVWGILLVVIGHSRYGAPVDPWWYTWIYSFHMPLFMFISGYLLRYGCEKKNISLLAMSLHERLLFLWKKVKRLLIPYWVISTIAFVPKVLLSRYAMRPLDFSFDDYVQMLIYPSDNVIVFFWFLPTLFLIFLLMVMFSSLKIRAGKSNLLIYVLLATLVLHLFNPLKNIHVLNLGGVANYLFYFILGYSSCRWAVFMRMGKFIYVGFVILFVISMLLVFIVPDLIGKDVMTALAGIAMSLYLSKIYVQNGWHFFHHLFGASYAIYLFSWFPQTVSQQVVQGLIHVPWQLTSVLAIITGIYFPWIIYKWIINHKYGKIGKHVALLTGQ